MLVPLRRRLHALAFVDEFGPIYAVYTLWFNDNGISTAQVSSIFIVWAAVALVLEIPSGALADRVDRRRLIAGAFVLRGIGISLWLVWPTLAGALTGAVLWAVHDALASGSWEAMIHDELEAIGEHSSYAVVMARVGQFSHLGVAAGTIAGGALLAAGVGLELLGWLTVGAHVASTSLVLALPDVRWVVDRDGQPGSVREWWSTLRRGVAEARSNVALSRLVVLGAVLEGLFILDEYIPLLSRARGGSDAAAPALVLVLWIGLLVGGECAARRPSTRPSMLGIGLIVGMALTTVAFLGEAVWLLGLVAVGYAALEAAWIATDARLQERTSGRTRATVTSVRGFGSATVSMLTFAAVGALSADTDPTPGLFVMVASLVAAGILIIRWLPLGSARPS